ncbi:zinc-ribbon domain-containing protein [Bacillus cereus]|uniref:zinc-ribbon domain-containing protein n=1 Tax=Bacillus cereus TaxID=1396 RepID=UPI001F0A19FA|nr:zinc-ribbon domain-containing protein [Bacillus cereus]
MKKCRKCAAELLDGANFCHVCGEKHGKNKKMWISIISIITIGTMSMGTYLYYYNGHSNKKVTADEKEM